MLRVVHEGTEATSALLLTFAAYLLLIPIDPDRRWRRFLALGLICGAAGLVRPTFALLWLPVAMLGAWRWDARIGARARTAGAIAAPAVVLVGGLLACNAVRFDRPTLTPLAPYHLNSRTSTYVEELPASYEPARSVLIRERDRALLLGEDNAPGNYIFEARPALEEATGLRGKPLEDLVMEMNVWLIVHNPFSYVEAVETASVDFSHIDSQPEVLVLGRPVAWAMQLVHHLLLLGAAGLLASVTGSIRYGRVRRGVGWTLVVPLVLAAYTWAISVAVETGTPRLRAPAEPLLVLLLVVSASVVRPARRVAP
jgi:hypothetical protein